MERGWLWDEEEWGPRYRMNDMFEEENRRCDKFIVAKAFADAIKINEMSIIRPYLTNPISFSYHCYHYPMIRHENFSLIDKEEFIKVFSEYFNNVDVYSASVIPTVLRRYYGSADIIAKAMDMKMQVHIDTFLNCVNNVYIFEEPDPMW